MLAAKRELNVIAREVHNIGTVGALIEALELLPREMAVGDVFSEPLTLEIEKIPGTREEIVTVR